MKTSVIERIYRARAKLDSLKPKVHGSIVRFGTENFQFNDDARAKEFAAEIIKALAPLVQDYGERCENILRSALYSGETEEEDSPIQSAITKTLFG